MGGMGLGVVGCIVPHFHIHHISGTTFRIQTFTQARKPTGSSNYPSLFLPSLLPLIRYSVTPISPLSPLPSPPPPPSTLSYPSLFPRLRVGFRPKNGGNESESGGERDGYIKHERRTEGETRKAKSSILNQSCGTKFCGTA